MANIVYTLADLVAAVLHAAAVVSPSTDLATGNEAATVVNAAIQQLTSEHEWSWLRKPLILDFAATTITSISRTSNVLTCTKAGHGLVAGDFIRLTGTTSVDGEYYVASAPTSATFTVNSTGSDGSQALPGSWIPAFVVLPTDFIGLVPGLERNSQIRAVFPRSMVTITRWRTAGGIYSTGPIGFYYCVRSIPQISATASPVKRLELYPTPTAAETAALAGEYRRQIPVLSGNTSVPDVGSDGMIHTLLRTLCRAMAVSTEEDRAGEDWRLYERMLPRVIERDGDEQTNLGMMEGGVDDTEIGIDHLYPTNISQT